MGNGELNFFSQFPYLAGNAISDHLNGLRGDDPFEKRIGLLQVNDATPLGLTHQYEANSKNLPHNFFNLSKDCRCSFDFRVKVKILELQDEWLKLWRYESAQRPVEPCVASTCPADL